MSATSGNYQDRPVNPRIKIAALWTAMLFTFVYVDFFGLFRRDVRADIEAGKIFAFTIGQGVLLGMTVYVIVPSLMVFLSLVLPVRITRIVNIVAATVYAITVLGGAIGEWAYYVVGSVTEAVLLAGIAYYAWTWPRVADDVAPTREDSRSGTSAHPEPTRR
jgi:hypothetical protein